jgi:hypothetical protein
LFSWAGPSVFQKNAIDIDRKLRSVDPPYWERLMSPGRGDAD